MKLFLLVFAYITLFSNATENGGTLELWKEFKIKYNKSYKSIDEENLRFAIFKNTLEIIEDHNVIFDKGESSYKMGINSFSDLTPIEFDATFNCRQLDFPIPSQDYVPNGFFGTNQDDNLPAEIDWRSKGAVLKVKNQGNCGSCWAFSAIGSLEGQIAIHHKKNITLSEQELIDCAPNSKNDGCKGGEMVDAFQYIIDNGISTEFDYPYTATNDTCKNTSTRRVDVNVIGYQNHLLSERELQKAVANVGPISIGFVGNPLQYYYTGILDHPIPTNKVNHAVLLVGYGTENNMDYWIIKNSYGPDWGENGYCRIIRGHKTNSLLSAVIFPEIDLKQNIVKDEL